MSNANPPLGAGRRLAQALGWQDLGTEGPSLKGPCIYCVSSDAFRVHIDSGIIHCFSCDKGGSAWDFAEAVAWDREDAKKAMVTAGLFYSRQTLSTETLENKQFQDGQEVDSSKTTEQLPTSPIKSIAQAKGTTKEGFLAYGAEPCKNRPGIKFRVYDPDGKCCSVFYLANEQDKGKFLKGHDAGLFWPMARAATGEKWLMVEGVKDASALWGIGHKQTVGLNTNRLNRKFCHLFQGVDLTIIPDRDIPSEEGARHTARVLAGHAHSVRFARLPGELAESHGDDVRDILKRPGGREQVERAIRLAVLLDNQGEPVDHIEYPLLSGPELAATEVELEALVERVLYRHQPAVIGGPSKTLKTSCLIDLGISLAVARKFLNEWWVPKSWRVALMSGESGIAALKNCYRRICESKNVNPKTEPHGFFVSESLPRLDSPAHLDAIRRMIEAHKLDVLMIDPMYLAAGTANSANLNEMGALLRATNDACCESGCTLILAHHTVKRPGLVIKRDSYEPLEREDLHGSGIGEWCRQWLLLNRRMPYQPNAPHEMNFCFGGSAGHSGFYALTVDEGRFDPKEFGGLEKWEATISSLEQTKELDRLEKERRDKDEKLASAIETLTEAVHAADSPFSPNAIRLAAKGAGRRFQDAWQHLLSEGVIAQHPTAIRSGRPLYMLITNTLV